MLKKYKRAKTVINQIKNGEWVFRWNNPATDFCTARRGNIELWVTNGPWFCGMWRPKDKGYFGIWRFWVYYYGVLPAKRKAYRERKRDAANQKKQDISYIDRCIFGEEE